MKHSKGMLKDESDASRKYLHKGGLVKTTHDAPQRQVKQKCSQTGNRTRAAWVRATNPNH